jgi:hypothetical protein
MFRFVRRAQGQECVAYLEVGGAGISTVATSRLPVLGCCSNVSEGEGQVQICEDQFNPPWVKKTISEFGETCLIR